MPRIALVTHTSAAVPPELIEQYAITLVPMQIAFLNGSYAEGADISTAEFYQRLEEEEVIPVTFPPSVPEYVRTFRALAANHDIILTVNMSNALSQAQANADLAASQVAGVRVVQHDSGSGAMGTGLQVLTAARMIEQGSDIEAIMAALQRQRERTLALFTPATLRFIRNSGRIGPIAALVAMWFGIRPVIQVVEGRLIVVERTRSLEAALDRQLVELATFLEGVDPVEFGVCHANDSEGAAAFAARVQAQYPRARVYIADQGPVLSVHTGPGMIGVATYRP